MQWNSALLLLVALVVEKFGKGIFCGCKCYGEILVEIWSQLRKQWSLNKRKEIFTEKKDWNMGENKTSSGAKMFMKIENGEIDLKEQKKAFQLKYLQRF